MTFREDVFGDIDRVFLDSEGGFATDHVLLNGQAATGIFFEPFLEAVPGGTVPVSSNDPMLRVSTAAAEAAGVIKGVAVSVEGETYRVSEVRPDGTGMTDLVLEEA